MSQHKAKTSIIIIYDHLTGTKWRTYLKETLTKDLGNGVSIFTMRHDRLPPPVESRKGTATSSKTYLGNGVLVVIMTEGHLRFILDSPHIDHKQAVLSNGLTFNPQQSYLILFDDVNFKQTDVSGVTLEKRFEHFKKWNKIFYKSEEDIQDLVKSIKGCMDENASDGEPRFVIKGKLTNNLVKCDESTTMTVVFDKEIPANSKVQVFLNLPGNPTNFPSETKICNPYVVTFKSFEHLEGEVKVRILVDGDEAGLEPNTLRYVSSSSEVNTISQFYIELMEVLMKKLVGFNVRPESLDELMSSIFTSQHVPAQAFELVFSLMEDSKTGSNDSKYPSLLHLGAAYGLKNFCSTLQDLPNSQCALERVNNKGKLPEDLAMAGGYRELAGFLEDSRKGNLDDLYITFIKNRNLNDTDEIYAKSRVKYLKCIGTRNEKWDETSEPEYIFCDQCLPAPPKQVLRKTDQLKTDDKKSNRLSDELAKLFRKFIEQEVSIVKTELQFEQLKSQYYDSSKNFDDRKKTAKLLREQVGKVKAQMNDASGKSSR